MTELSAVDPHLEDRIRDALSGSYAVAGQPPDVTTIWRSGRSRHKRRLIAALCGIVGTLAICAIGIAALTGPGTSPSRVVPATDANSPTPNPSPPTWNASSYCIYRAPALGAKPALTDDVCFSTQAQADAYNSAHPGG